MIRKEGLVIDDSVIDKITNLSFQNMTHLEFSATEIYLCGLIYEKGFDISDLNSPFIFDIESNCIRFVIHNHNEFICKGLTPTTFVRVPHSKALVLLDWEDSRSWLKKKGFFLEFHYDPFSKDEKIKLGFMRPKSENGDAVIIESDGNTDLEAIYKIVLEALSC